MDVFSVVSIKKRPPHNGLRVRLVVGGRQASRREPLRLNYLSR